MLSPRSGPFLGVTLLSCITLLLITTGASRAHAESRTIDGTYNNLGYSDYGAANTQLLRFVATDYGDGVSSPAGADRPGPRAISNIVFAQSESISAVAVIGETERFVSGYLFQWGQFIDHDLDLTEAAYPPEPFHIAIPEDDPVFPTTAVIPFLRSIFDPYTGTGLENPRQQIN